MKLLANLLVVFSLLLGQFSMPSSKSLEAENSTPTPTVDIATVTPTVPTPIPATETPTPVVTETITPQPTSTEVPDTETVPPAEPQIAINLDSTPGFVTPGGYLTIHWAIQGISPAEHALSLTILLPQGFTPTDKDAIYDEATLTLSIPILKESGQFGLQTDQPAEDAVLMASLVEKEAILAEFALPLPTHEQFTIDEKGGEVITEDGRVKITFPENVLTEETTISVGQPSGKDAPAHSSGRHPFEITATTKAAKMDLHQFEQPITIEVQYGDLNIPDEKLTDLYIYWYNPETGNWEALDSRIDRQAQTIRTETYHFSVFDININDWQAARMPTVDSFQVSQFTGDRAASSPACPSLTAARWSTRPPC
jgi:hypothetical protein